MTHDEISTEIGALAVSHFATFAKVEAREDFDSDGDPFIAVKLILRDPDALRDASRLLTFRLEARRLLESKGEIRFPTFAFILEAEYGKHAAA